MSVNILPYIIDAGGGRCLADDRSYIEMLIRDNIHQAGAVLIRGYDVRFVSDFSEFVGWYTSDLLSYSYGSTPRKVVSEGVYSSTEYPADQHIVLHNEMAYTNSWPAHLWFYCEQPSKVGGETPLADSRKILLDIPEEIRKEFLQKDLLYIRNFRPNVDVSWQSCFETEDKSQVEAYCNANNIEFSWKSDKELQTRQVCPAVIEHPVTKEQVWFNQAHLFHVSNIDARFRIPLIRMYGEKGLPRNVYFGDASPIHDDVITEINKVLVNNRRMFKWLQGDILMIDNLLCAHGRAPFEGERKVRVAMA